MLFSFMTPSEYVYRCYFLGDIDDISHKGDGEFQRSTVKRQETSPGNLKFHHKKKLQF